MRSTQWPSATLSRRVFTGRRGDRTALATEAASYEGFGSAEAVPAILAEAGQLWNLAGEPRRARALVEQVVGAGFTALTGTSSG